MNIEIRNKEGGIIGDVSGTLAMVLVNNLMAKKSVELTTKTFVNKPEKFKVFVINEDYKMEFNNFPHNSSMKLFLLKGSYIKIIE